MDKYKKIGDQLRSFYTSQPAFYLAEIESVQGTTCTVKIDDLFIPEVKIKCTSGQLDSKVLLIPKPGTHAIVGSYSGDLSNLFIVSVDEVDKVEITVNEQNVMSLLSDWLQTLANAKVIVGNATGTFEPKVVTKLKSIETKFKQIFK